MDNFVNRFYWFYRGRSGYYAYELPDEDDRNKMIIISLSMLAEDIRFDVEETR